MRPQQQESPARAQPQHARRPPRTRIGSLPSARAAAWLSEGDTFGEAALLDPSRRRGRTVTAGDGGTHLATLDRSALLLLSSSAAAAGGADGWAGPGAGRRAAAAAAQAVLGAACRRLLAAPPGQRVAEDIGELAVLLGGLEVGWLVVLPPLPPLLRAACNC